MTVSKMKITPRRKITSKQKTNPEIKMTPREKTTPQMKTTPKDDVSRLDLLIYVDSRNF